LFNCTGFWWGERYGFALFVYKKKNQEYVYHTQSAGNRTTSIYKVLINSTNTNSHKLYQIQIAEATFLAGLRLKIQQLNIDIEPHNTRKRRKKKFESTQKKSCYHNIFREKNQKIKVSMNYVFWFLLTNQRIISKETQL
jgi:hypothetical protein